MTTSEGPTAPNTIDARDTATGLSEVSYLGYAIRVKQDMGSHPPMIDGLPCLGGYLVCDEAGNIMPGDLWFQTVAQAKAAIDVWIAVARNAERFMEAWTAYGQDPRPYRSLLDIRVRLRLVTGYIGASDWLGARNELQAILDDDYWRIPPTIEQLPDPSCYLIFSREKDAWLQGDERTWGRISDAVYFANYKLAVDIAEREVPGLEEVGVLAWLDPYRRQRGIPQR